MPLFHFLLTYDARAGRLENCEQFADAADASARFAEREAEYREDRQIQVVLLAADSRATLEKTHAHFFQERDAVEALEQLAAV